MSFAPKTFTTGMLVRAARRGHRCRPPPHTPAPPGGGQMLQNRFDVDRRCGFTRKISKLNREAPFLAKLCVLGIAEGGGRKFLPRRIPRTGGALTRRFFSRSRDFQHGRDCKLEISFAVQASAAKTVTQSGIYFPAVHHRGVVKSPDTSGSGPAGKRKKMRRDIARNCFLRRQGRRWLLEKSPRNSGWGG